MEKRLLNITGGATKFIQLLIAVHYLHLKGYKFTDITCKSSSALFIIPYLLGKYRDLYKEGVELDLNKYFKVPPTDGEGNLTAKAKARAVWSFMPNWIPGGNINSFGVQDVEALFTKYMSKEDFNKYKNGHYPNVHVVSVRPSQAKQDKVVSVVNLKHCTYKEAKAYILGSAAIQVFTNAIEIKGEDHVDGGMYTAGAGGYLLDTGYFKNVESVVSIYSWTDPHFGIKESETWKENIGNNSARVAEIFKASNKWYADRHEYWYCKANNIPRLEVKVPDVFKNTYEVNPETIAKAVTLTKQYMKQIK